MTTGMRSERGTLSVPGFRMSDRVLHLQRGDVIWAAPDPAIGREQLGRRPAVIVASDRYIERVRALIVILPITTRDRGWPTHVRLRGADLNLSLPSFAMTEQIRSIDRARIETRAGRVDEATLVDIDAWLSEHLGLTT